MVLQKHFHFKMKSFVVLMFLTVFVVFAKGDFFPTKKCPPGEHSVLYCPRMDEADCDTPTVHERTGPSACDIPDCFCDRPTVRDLRTRKCVKLEDCPKKNN